jgi:hypothetical protein
MLTAAIIGLFALSTNIKGALAVCNGFGDAESDFAVPPGHCFGIKSGAEEIGVIFECPSAVTNNEAMGYAYENADCSGDVFNSTELTGTNFTCDGTDCSVVIMTMYFNSTGCTATGDYMRVPIATDGCINDEDGTSMSMTCSAGTLTMKQYNNAECSGSSTLSSSLSSGCVDAASNVYISIKCGAAALGVTRVFAMVAVVLAYLAQ